MRAPLGDPLTQPHGPFRNVLAAHWTQKRETIIAQLRAEAAAQSSSKASAPHLQPLKPLVDEVRFGSRRS